MVSPLGTVLVKSEIMKLQTLILPVALLFFSCAKYQYMTISSDLPQDHRGAFAFENDTLELVYRYTPEGYIEVEITNNLDHLIYVDWSKSAMIFDSRSFPFFSNEMFFSAVGQSMEWVEGFATSNTQGSVFSSPALTYIHPHAKVSRMFFDVPFTYLEFNEGSDYEKVSWSNATGKRYYINPLDSLDFHQSYIYLGDDNGSSPYLLSHTFWITEVVETNYNTFPASENQFVIESPSNGSGEGALLLSLAIIGTTAELLGGSSDPVCD